MCNRPIVHRRTRIALVNSDEWHSHVIIIFIAIHTERKDVPSKIDSNDLGEVSLTKAQRDTIVFTKYESQNPMVSDTQHQGTWHIQVTSDQSLGDKLGLREDDGVIIDFEGIPRGEVAISSLGEELSDSQAALREETTGQNLPRFIAFDFRVKKLTKPVTVT